MENNKIITPPQKNEQEKISAKIEEDKKAINLHWTGYCFMLANILLIIAITIAWGLCARVPDITPTTTDWKFDMSIFTPATISLILVFIFYFFDSREMYLVRQHIDKKLVIKYFIGGFIYILNIIFMFTYTCFINKIMLSISSSLSNNTNASLPRNITFGILFGIVGIITLVTLGYWRYIRFKIDLTLVRRRHGIISPINKTPLNSTSNNDVNNKQEV